MDDFTRFITFVDLSLGNRWRWTIPKKKPEGSYKAAENMVSARIMEDRGFSRHFPNFSIRLRELYPKIVGEARKHIGKTREVVLEEGETPKDFQRKFHQVRW